MLCNDQHYGNLENLGGLVAGRPEPTSSIQRLLRVDDMKVGGQVETQVKVLPTLVAPQAKTNLRALTD